MESKAIYSGIMALDEVLKGLRLGDNVVWQVDNLKDYVYFIEPFVDQALDSGGKCVYLRFAPHPPIINPRRNLVIKEVDPRGGFAFFSAEVHRVIEEWARKNFLYSTTYQLLWKSGQPMSYWLIFSRLHARSCGN